MIFNTDFIQITYLKKNTPIQDNVDDNILTPYIKIAQDLHIQKILGSAFYNRLMEGVALDNLTIDEDDLLRNFIQPALAQWAFYEVLPHLNYKPTNKAISQENSEFSTSSTLEDIKFLRNSIRDISEFLLERLVNQLCDFRELYPIYLNPGDKENLDASNRNYFSGVFIPKSRSGKCYNNCYGYCDCYK